MSEKCSGRSFDGWSYYPCSFMGKLEHDGKWWCKRHHPPTVKAKRDAMSAKWRAEAKAKDEERQRLQAIADRKEAIVRAAEDFIATPAYGPAFEALRAAVEMEGKEQA